MDAYKTILLHINDERRVGQLVDAATRIACDNEAHLCAVYVLPPVPTGSATPAGSSLIKKYLEPFREEAARIRATFESATRNRPFVSEWRLLEARHRSLLDALLGLSRTADLIVASQRDRDWPLSPILDCPEQLTLQSGRPVIVVPHTGRFTEIGRRVTVAFNGKRESARAAFDALPLLKRAETVRIVWIDPRRDDAGDVPTADLAAALARHGIRPEAAVSYGEDLKVGDNLLSGLADDGSDLLVMGAYGHSRWRELVFGGATQHILDAMTVPVLLSH
jgi:nucleotide-binding universal stress UspA family protein